MKAAHTPGPWAIEDPLGDDGGLWIVEGGKQSYEWGCIATVDRDVDSIRPILAGERNANARLIAAAPDMLEALEALAPHIRLRQEPIEADRPQSLAQERALDERAASYDAAVRRARAAIAKATGEPARQAAGA